MKNLNLNKFLYFKGFFSKSKKNYIQTYPTTKVRVDKNTREIIKNDAEIKTKKPEDVKYSNKFEINIDNLHDYDIIGAEIFKNSFKESLKKKAGSDSIVTDFDSIAVEEMEKDIYRPAVEPLAWSEPDKYNKYFTRRTFYDQANPKFRHMFVPSWRYKIEPFNALKVFKWGYIDGDRKSHNLTQFKRNSYVEGFSGPFNVNNSEVDKIINELAELQLKFKLDYNNTEFQKIVNDIYKKPENSENEGIRIYVSLIEKFLTYVPSINYKTMPNLLMKLFYELSFNSKKLWIAFEEVIMNNLHHYTIPELSRIMFIASVTSPKYNSENFRLTLTDTVLRALEGNNLSLNELHSIAIGFRYTKKRIIYNKLAENFIRRKAQLLGDGKNNCQIISQMFYSWAANKPKNELPRTYYPQMELIESFITTYEDELNDCILKMTPEDIWRFTTALYLLKTDSVDLFINRIERNLIKLKSTSPDKIDSWTLHSVLRAFSKMKDNKMAGSDKFFVEMESLVIRDLEGFKLSFQQFTDILYAYSVRGSGSEKLYNLFNKKLNEDFTKANNYHSLFNICWYYLFTENKSLDQWSVILKQFNQIEERVPIYYYRPFKIASFYLKNAFKKEDLDNKLGDMVYDDFIDRFYDPEQIYDYVKHEKFFDKHPEYTALKAMINGRMVLFPVPHMVFDNCFMIHLCWENRKIGINVWLSRDTVPKSNPLRVNKVGLVNSQMMRLQGWEILDVVWEDFMNMNGQLERDRFIFDWFAAASKRQEKNGVFKLNIKIV